MRHGNAQAFAKRDRERELTELGIQQVQSNAKWLSQLPMKIDLVLVSPYVRAQQTWELVSNWINVPTYCQTLADLVPNGNATQVHDHVDALIQLEKPQSILMVSHMPLVSYLVESFTMQAVTPMFCTAAIAHLVYEPQSMKGVLCHIKSP